MNYSWFWNYHCPEVSQICWTFSHFVNPRDFICNMWHFRSAQPAAPTRGPGRWRPNADPLSTADEDTAHFTSRAFRRQVDALQQHKGHQLRGSHSPRTGPTTQLPFQAAAGAGGACDGLPSSFAGTLSSWDEHSGFLQRLTEVKCFNATYLYSRVLFRSC